ncbi:MAG: type II toxin-antitoxin system Phd/YefM family antitoxin [Candidatus Bipolaricaulota bacterium]|nr:type II toxin-antitoxin system Phd/YefM family antitoxin [Candidatus Bipolaricaulota bacterium]MDW8127531.1 type II toxin-antitoxin system prevent-host-death family antitoxin [Candidatus Bipolaricaulota bacterium]
MIREIGAVEARQRLGEFLARVRYGRERFVITRDGKRTAALIAVEDLERLEGLEELLDLLAVQVLKAQGQEPVPVEALLTQYRQLFAGAPEPAETREPASSP